MSRPAIYGDPELRPSYALSYQPLGWFTASRIGRRGLRSTREPPGANPRLPLGDPGQVSKARPAAFAELVAVKCGGDWLCSIAGVSSRLWSPQNPPPIVKPAARRWLRTSTSVFLAPQRGGMYRTSVTSRALTVRVDYAAKLGIPRVTPGTCDRERFPIPFPGAAAE